MRADPESSSPLPAQTARVPGSSPSWEARLTGRFRSVVALFTGRSAQAGYLAAVDQGLISLANFLATIILARAVSPTELGIYGVGFTCLRLVRSVQDGVAVQPVSAFGPAMPLKDFRRYATSTAIFQILLALVSAAAVALGGWALTAWGNDTAGPALFSLWFAFLGWQLQEFIRRLLYTRGAVASAVLNTALANGIRLGILLHWAERGSLNGAGGLHAIAWGSLAAMLPGIWQARSYWTRDFEPLGITWRRNWGFGRWILGSSLAGWLSVEFYPVLTAGMISFAAAGAYRALQNLVAPIHLLLRAIDTFLTPRAARQYAEEGRPALARSLKLTYLIAGAPVLGLLGLAVLFPGPLLRFLYGETYLAYQNAAVLMALFYALLFAYWPVQIALKAAQTSRPIFTANLIATVLMFTVGLGMILRWGVDGTIAGQALSALVVAVFLWTAWRRRGES